MTREQLGDAEEPEEPIEEAAEPAVIILSQVIFGPVDDTGEPIVKPAVDVEAAIARHARAEVEPDVEAPVFTFVGHEAPLGGSIVLHFICPNPGPNLGATYDLSVPEADIDGLKDQATFNAYVMPLLAAMVGRAEHPSADKLDGWLRGTVTI